MTSKSLKNYPVFTEIVVEKVPLPHEFMIVARFNGGSNAEHTSVVSENNDAHCDQIPCGLLVSGTRGLIGPKCLINIEARRRAQGTSIGTTLWGYWSMQCGKSSVLSQMPGCFSNRNVTPDIIFEGTQSVELNIRGTHSSTGVYQNVESNITILAMKVYDTYIGDKKFQLEGDVFVKIAKVGSKVGTRMGPLVAPKNY